MSKKKVDAEKFQHQLLELLKDDSNRVCADCKARGPRWASWNLGVFICIRCAGMHRNLGVHIAKVKSVNLDTWTQEQVDNMLAWGNGVANEYYEYKLPSDFRRPSDDPGIEKFIRNKYDKKLYVHDNFDYSSSIKNHPTGGVKGEVKSVPVNTPVAKIPVVPLKKPGPYVPPKIPLPAVGKPSASQPVTRPAVSKPAAATPSLLQVSLESTPAPAPAPAKPAANADLFDLFGEMVTAPQPSNGSAVPAPAGDSLLQEEKPKQSFKDSIMSLYGSSAQFGPPPPPQQQQMMMPPGSQMSGNQFNIQQMQQPGAQFGNNGYSNGSNNMMQGQMGQFNGQQFYGQQQTMQGQNMMQNNMQNMQGFQNRQAIPNMQGINNIQTMQNMRGMHMQNNQSQGMQGMNMQNMQGMPNMQGFNQGQGMYRMPQQQFGMNQMSAPNQQQHFDTIQKQLQQLKVTQQPAAQQGWVFGSG